MRVAYELYQQKPLHSHALLSDVFLHDVWTFHLQGGGASRSLRDFQALFTLENLQQVNPAVKFLFGLRGFLGRLFGWDNETHRQDANSQIAAASYIHRLNATDHSRSMIEPGAADGPFQVVFAFENEALAEIINGTVHAFSLLTMEPAADGYTVYWAIYVKNVSWLTPLYMLLIDPFRRWLIYPAIIKHIERVWALTYQK